MHLEFNIFSLLLLITGTIVAVISTVIVFRLNDAVRWFAFTMLAVSVWALAYGFELASQHLELMLFWIKIEYLGISFAPLTWIWFCIKYSGFDNWTKRRYFILLFIIPMTTYLMVFTNQYHYLHYKSVAVFTDGPFPLLDIEPGPWYYVHTVFFYLMLLIGNILLLVRFKHADPVYKRQTYLLVLSGIFPWLMNAIYLSGVRPLQHIDLTPFAFLVIYIVVGIGLLRYGLFDIKPIAKDRVISAMTKGLLVLDPKNRIIDFNPAINRILHENKKDLIGQRFESIFSNYPTLLQCLNQREYTTVELEFSENNKSSDYSIEFVPFLDKKKIFSGMLVQFDDVTEKNNIHSTLIAQTNELRNLNALKDKLFTIISHDLKGPVFGIRELVHLANEEIISKDEFFDILPEISKNMDSVSMLLENLLAWTSSQLKGEFVQKAAFNLDNVLGQQVTLFEKFAHEKELVLSIEKSGDLEVIADKNMIDLVLRNLINNAIKFSDKGGQITITAKEMVFQVLLKISDTGKGISQENLKKINAGESFTTPGQNKETGTGLGLILVKDYIIKNGGKLLIESTLGKGSSFSFLLPKTTQSV